MQSPVGPECKVLLLDLCSSRRSRGGLSPVTPRMPWCTPSSRLRVPPRTSVLRGLGGRPRYTCRRNGRGPTHSSNPSFRVAADVGVCRLNGPENTLSLWFATLDNGARKLPTFRGVTFGVPDSSPTPRDLQSDWTPVRVSLRPTVFESRERGVPSNVVKGLLPLTPSPCDCLLDSEWESRDE